MTLVGIRAEESKTRSKRNEIGTSKRKYEDDYQMAGLGPMPQKTEGQSILRERAGGMGLYRKFYYAGITFIEVPTGVNGSTYIPAGECYFVAEADDDSFVTYYGPANRFGLVNTIAMPQYMWQFPDPRGTEITLEAEMNMLNVLKLKGL